MKKYFGFLVCLFVYVSVVFPQVNYYYYLIPSGTTNNLTYIYSLSSNNNFITGANGTILRSTVPGANIWLPVTSGTTNNLNGIMLKNNITGMTYYVFGNNGTVIAGSNYGANWTQQNSGVTTQLYAGSVVTGDTVTQYKYLIVGSGGTIIYKMLTGGSGNWEVLSGVTTSNLKSVYFIGKVGWISGSNGTIMKSINAGMNWATQATGVTNELNSIYFLNTSIGLAVGNGGIISRTANGGTNWTQVTSGTSQNLNQVVSSGVNDTVFIVGNNGTILKSANIGLNWSTENYVPNVSFTSGYIINNNLFVVGDGGKIYKRMIDSTYHNLNPNTLSGNNIRSYFDNHGIFDQNTTVSNQPGFEWPKGSNLYAIFTAGLTIAAKVNGEMRMAAASYTGEYKPGYCTNGIFQTNQNFKFYKITRGDNAQNNWDWANWGYMVPFGAPYIDVNNNGIYEPAIDTPGVRNAKETMFICLTDADTNSHIAYEGFGGGTKPLGVELRMTIWEYDSPSYLQNVQFINYDFINKSLNTWNAVKTGIYCDPDLGDSNDDYDGCDTTLNLGFCYNGDNNDPQFGLYPPAVGMTLLRGPLNRSITPNVRLKMTSYNYSICAGCPAPPCELDPNGQPIGAYNLLSGVKKDSTSWLDPTQNPPKKTKFCYSGDPETNVGWTEGKGSIWNCNGDTTGVYHIPNPTGDRRFILGSGANNFNIVPGESQKFVIAQLITRGTSNLNSVTKLKVLTSQVINFYNTNFPIGTELVSISGNVKFQDNNQIVTSGSVKAFRLNTITGQITVLDSTGIQPNGNYILNNVPQGDVRIGAVPNSSPPVDYVGTYYPSTIYWQNATVLNPMGNLTDINIRVFRLSSVTSSNFVNGKVNSAAPVAPLKDANVYAKSGNTFVGFSTTGASGIYSLASLPSGSLRVIVDRLGYLSDSVTVNLTSSPLDSVNFYLVRTFIGIKTTSSEIPDKYYLYQNYPNPFNPTTNIKFQIKDSRFVTLKIYNVLGKEIASLVNEKLKAGSYEVKYSAENLSSGIYFYKLMAGDFSETKRMVLIK